MLPSDWKAEVIESLKQAYPEAWAIYVFGSYATQEQSGESDLDLALLSPGPLEPVGLWECSQRLAGRFGTDVDLVDLWAASTVFRAQILNKGERLACFQSKEANLFETTALSQYLRFNEERAEILAGIRQDKNRKAAGTCLPC